MQMETDRELKMTNMKTITFRNNDMYWDIAADCYFPADFDESKKYPVIISAHPVGSCKEQTSGKIYGTALAKEGFVVIAFDASFQGSSGGEPRYIENPGHRVDDFRHVVDYLVTLPYVDKDRIGVLGICGGGGYALNAALTEKRLKAIGTVTAVNLGRLARQVFAGNQPLLALKGIVEQRGLEAEGGKLKVEALLPPSVAEAKAQGITDIDILGAVDYYRTPRGEDPHGQAQFLLSHQAAVMAWDAFHLADMLLTQPLMVVVGDKVGGFGAYCDGVDIIGRAASKQKELVVIKDAAHYDLYDQSEPVKQALAKLVPFYKKYL